MPILLRRREGLILQQASGGRFTGPSLFELRLREETGLQLAPCVERRARYQGVTHAHTEHNVYAVDELQ